MRVRGGRQHSTRALYASTEEFSGSHVALQACRGCFLRVREKRKTHIPPHLVAALDKLDGHQLVRQPVAHEAGDTKVAAANVADLAG